MCTRRHCVFLVCPEGRGWRLVCFRLKRITGAGSVSHFGFFSLGARCESHVQLQS